jgi:hypothetical protein
MEPKEWRNKDEQADKMGIQHPDDGGWWIAQQREDEQ